MGVIRRYAQFRKRQALRQARWWDEYPGRMTALLALGVTLRLYNRYEQYQRDQRLKKLTDISRRIVAARDVAEAQRMGDERWKEQH